MRSLSDTSYAIINLTTSGNAHVINAFNKNYVRPISWKLRHMSDLASTQAITNNKKWTVALGVFYVSYCRCLFFPSSTNIKQKLPQGLLEIPANGYDRPAVCLHVLYSDLTCSSTTAYWRQSIVNLCFLHKHSVIDIALLQLLPFSCILGFSFSLYGICERISCSACVKVRLFPESWSQLNLCIQIFIGDRRSWLLRWNDLLSIILVQAVCPQSVLPMPDNSMLIGGL